MIQVIVMLWSVGATLAVARFSTSWYVGAILAIALSGGR